MSTTISPDLDRDVASLHQEAEETLRSKTLLQKALWRLWHDRLTLVALGFLGFLTLLCFSAPLLIEYVLDIDYNNPDLYNNNLPIGAEVADSDTTLFMWDIESGELKRPFIGHIQRVVAADYSPDGEFFVTGSDDGFVRVWQIATGRNKRQLQEHTKAVNSLAFSPDGSTFATASADGTAGLWHVTKADPRDVDIPIHLFAGHSDSVTSVDFSPDGLTLVTASADKTAMLWDVETGENVLTLEGHTGAVNRAVFSPDGATVLTGSADNTARLWDVLTGESLRTFEGEHTAAIKSVAFSPDGTTFASGSADNTAVIWDVANGEALHTFEGHTDAATGVVFSPDGTTLVTTSLDGTARLWDTTSGEVVQTFDEVAYAMYGLAMSPDGTTMVTGTNGDRRTYLLGTDQSGRDHFTRLLFGGQVSLKIGFFSALGALTIGVLIGVSAGYFGGVFDDIIVWVITTLDSIPQLFLLLIISAVLAPNETSLILVLVFLGWTTSTRIMRGETFALREREFVVAARAIGASNLRIMFSHIAPNVISVLLIVLSRAIGGLILAESALSFLGFGVKPPTPTWGNMLSGGLDLLRDAPHLVFAPGLLISVVVLCLYVIGDGLRDAFDPHLSD